jgi:hypothetical protein
MRETGWLGEIRYSEARQRAAAQDAIRRAEADLEAARRTEFQRRMLVLPRALGARDEAQKRFDEADRRHQGVLARENAGAMGAAASNIVAGNVGGPIVGWLAAQVAGAQFRDKAGRAEASNDVLAAGLELDKQRARVAEERANWEKSALDVAEKESALRKASLSDQKQELAFAEAKVNRMATAAERMGALLPMERKQGVMAVETIQKYGYENVPQMVRQMAERVAPEWVRRKRQAAGEASPEYKQLQQMPGEVLDKGTLREARQTVAKLEQNVRVNVIIDEAKTRDAVMKAVTEAMKEWAKDIKIEIHDKMKEINARQQGRNNLGGS